MRLHLCWRSINLSSDDLACPALTSLGWRALWIASLVALLVLNGSVGACTPAASSLYFAVVVLSCIFALTDCALFSTASAGTLVNPQARATVPAWFAARLAVAVVELGLVCAVEAEVFLGCGVSRSAFPAAVALAVAAALGVVVSAGGLLGACCLAACGYSAALDSDAHLRRPGDAALAVSSIAWASCCRGLAGAPLCCFSSGRRARLEAGAPDPYTQVGAVMAGVLEAAAALRLTMSDVVAGL